VIDTTNTLIVLRFAYTLQTQFFESPCIHYNINLSQYVEPHILQVGWSGD